MKNTRVNSQRPTMVVTTLLAALAVGLAGCHTADLATGAQIANVQPLNAPRPFEPNYLLRRVQDDVFYFVLPDRFYNADPSNDLGSATIALSRGGFDPRHKAMYHGGDIQGLQAKLPYIKGMGATAIWLTPILRNQAIQGGVSGYHGYWVLDFTEIDPHLGSNQDLKNFIAAAHDMGLKVFFDIITNHTADVIKLSECHGADGAGWSSQAQPCPYKSLAQVKAGQGYTTVVPKGSEQVKSPAWLNDPRFYHSQGDSTFSGENSIYGDFFGLDDVDTDNPQVVSGMIDIFNQLVSEFKPDGFRVDTVKHVNIEFWQQFSPAIINHAKSIGIPQFFMFGEVYSGDAKVLSHYTLDGKLPSVLDFGFQSAVYQSLVAGKGAQPLIELFDRDPLYRDQQHDEHTLLNFIGNHDMGRFGFHLQQQHPHMADSERLQRSQLAHALMYFSRGIPVIYYGDEQGFVGDNGDHDARQDMMPSQVASYNDDDLIGTDQTTKDDNFDPQHPLYQSLRRYGQLYQQHDGLRYGQQTVIPSGDPDVLLIRRGPVATGLTPSADQAAYVIVFNTSNQAKTLTAATISQALHSTVKGIETGADTDQHGYQQIFPELVSRVTDSKTNNNGVQLDQDPLMQLSQAATLTIAGLSFAIYTRRP